MHKTLPALGQSALLTAGPRVSAERLRYASSLFGSASPSYLMMANMDLARAYMEAEGGESQKEIAEETRTLASGLHERGIDTLGQYITCDPLRVTANLSSLGITGYEAGRILEEEFQVAPEMADRNNLVFILSTFDSKEKLEKLFSALSHLVERRKDAALPSLPVLPRLVPVLRPREASLSPERIIRLSESEGEIASRPISVFPPGIQLIGAGERIGQKHIEFLLEQGQSSEKTIYIVDQPNFGGAIL
jgi:lysine decarboxylase